MTSGYVLAPSDETTLPPSHTRNSSDDDLLDELEHSNGVPLSSKPVLSSPRRVRFQDEQGHTVIIPGEYLDGNLHLATKEQKKRRWWRNAIINSLFILSWFFFGTCLSVYNKWMFSPEKFGFPFPLFVTSIHMIVQFLLASTFRFIWPKAFKPENSPNSDSYIKKVIPTSVATSLDIGLSNLSMKTITLSFYTMCKSSSLIFVLLFAFLFRLEQFNLRLVGVILLITSGVVLMVATETKFVLTGMLLVISAAAFGGLRWSLTQLLLKKKDMGMNNPCATVYWLAPPMAITLAILSLIIEQSYSVFQTQFFENFGRALKTSFLLIAPGSLAFFMVLSEFYIIQRAGVLPMSIAGIFKEVTTISVSALVFGDELTPLNITGVLITFCGIILFTYNKYRKSIDSVVPLDAHGNPIIIEEDDGAENVETIEEEALIPGRVEEGLSLRSPNVIFSTRTADFEHTSTPTYPPRPGVAG